MKTTDQAGATEPASEATSTPLPAGARAITVPTRKLGWLVGPIAAGWLASGAAALTHVEWILLPLLVAAVSSVLRTGRNVVDRLMLSAVMVAAALVAGGLAFSLWPWGLAPLPVTGSLFTAVAVVAWLGNRRPRLPRGFSLSDLMVVGTGLFVFVAGVRPVRRLPLIDRLAFGATSEDRAAHFAFFDTIHRLGSYPFLDQEAARVSLQTPAEATYPTGSHFLYAIVDIFTRSTTDPGPAIPEFNRYVVLMLAGYAFFVMTAVWASRWILTPLVGGWRLLVATSTVAAVLVGGPLMTLVTAGFDSQVLGIAFVALTMAVAIRPPASIGDRIALFGAGTVLVAYTYYLYLPLVAIGILASFLVDRRLLRLHWRPLLVSAVLLGAISVIPLYFAATSTLDLGAQALVTGTTMWIPRSELVAATVGSLAVLVTPAALRQRRIRVTGLLISAVLGVTLLFGVYQKARLGTTSYYFEKLLVCYFVIAIICSATLVTFLGRLGGPSRGTHRGRLNEACLGIIAAVLAFTAVAGFGPNRKVSDPVTGTWGETPLGMWFTGRQQMDTTAPNLLKDMGARGLLADGTTTIFLIDNTGYQNWRITFTNAILNRTNGATMAAVNKVQEIAAGATPLDRESLNKALANVDTVVSLSKRPLRIVVRDRETAEAIERAIGAKSDVHATVVLLPKP
jgi:hypothetical protein